MKVLLSAFACAPARGSEPGVGWGLVREIAREHDVWVLTSSANRDAIGCTLAENPLPRARFLFLPPFSALARWAAIPGVHHLAYCLWQWHAFRTARRLHKEIGFDLVHHITYVNSWLPCFMGLVGPPFVWNAGGREGTPFRFLSSLSLRGRLTEFARNITLPILAALTLANSAAARRAACILSCSPIDLWPAGIPVVQFPLGGLSRAEFEFLRSLPPRRDSAFRVLSVGRFLPWKGFSLGLRAFASFHRRNPSSEYWIIGDGMDRKHLERLAAREGVSSFVRFFDWIPRRQLLPLLADADVLLHPSFHEQFGYVLLEAMAVGRPVVCLDSGGPSVLVQNDAGVKVPVTTPTQVIESIAASLEQLASDPGFRSALARRAQQHVETNWLWDRVGARLRSVYLLAASGSPVTLPLPLGEAKRHATH